MNNNEIAAFENFKFKIGDIVILVIEGPHGQRGMVTERLLVEYAAGVCRRYVVSSAESTGVRDEAELELWPRPVRM